MISGDWLEGGNDVEGGLSMLERVGGNWYVSDQEGGGKWKESLRLR